MVFLNKWRKQILVIAVITLIVSILAIVYVFFVNGDESTDNSRIVDFSTEEINIDEYFIRRSNSYSDALYAILIWRPEETPSQMFLEELEAAFEGKRIKIFTFDVTDLEEEEYIRVVADVTELMGLDEPDMMVPTLIIMRDGSSIFEQAGLIFRDAIVEYLTELGIR